MARTLGEIEQSLYNDILTTPLAEALGAGSIYKRGMRPQGLAFNAEIAITAADPFQVQEGRARITIYVKRIPIDRGTAVRDITTCNRLEIILNSSVEELLLGSDDIRWSLASAVSTIDDDQRDLSMVVAELQFKLFNN